MSTLFSPMNRVELSTVYIVAAGLLAAACLPAQSNTEPLFASGIEEPRNTLTYADRAPDAPALPAAVPPRPAGFVNLQGLVPGIRIELRYAGSYNFIGRPIAGYESKIVYLTREAATALGDVQKELAAEGLGLKVFDGYRPQRAVDDFVAWAADPGDNRMKPNYYPTVDKSRLIADGYIAEHSDHSRGSTVDLTLVELDGGEELNMGSPYDYFGPISAPSSRSIGHDEYENRMKLREIMLRHGFEPLEEEWWHFTLRDEPFPDTYFDFPVR
jgi:D-alanyl-D-alanine dipeptidase